MQGVLTKVSPPRRLRYAARSPHARPPPRNVRTGSSSRPWPPMARPVVPSSPAGRGCRSHGRAERVPPGRRGDRRGGLPRVPTGRGAGWHRGRLRPRRRMCRRDPRGPQGLVAQVVGPDGIVRGAARSGPTARCPGQCHRAAPGAGDSRPAHRRTGPRAVRAVTVSIANPVDRGDGRTVEPPSRPISRAGSTCRRR